MSGQIEIALVVKDDGTVVLGDVQKKVRETGDEATKTKGKLASVKEGILQGFGQSIGLKAINSVKAAIAAIPDAAIGATTRLIETGGALTDLSAKTTISTDALQKFKYAGSLVGVELSQITASAQVMQRNLLTTPKVFENLGLSAENLKKQNIGDAFQQVAEQIRKIPDPALQTKAAIDALGRGALQILPLIRSGLADTAAEAEKLGIVMSKDVIAAADDLGDSGTKLAAVWEGVQNNFASAVVTSEPLHVLLEGLVEIVGMFSKSLNENQGFMRALVDGGVRFLAASLTQLAKGLPFLIDLWSGLKIMLAAVEAGFRDAAETAQVAWRVIKGDMSAADGLKAIMKAHEQNRAAMAKTIGEEMALNSERQATAKKVIAAFEDLEKKVANSAGAVHKSAEAVKAVGASYTFVSKEAEKAAEAERKAAEHRMKAAVEASKGLLDNFKTVRSEAEQLEDYLDSLPGFKPQMDAGKPGKIPMPGDPGKDWGIQFTQGFKKGVAGLPAAILGAIQGGGNIGQAIGSTLGSSVGDALGKVAGERIKGVLGKALAGAIPVVGALAGPLLGKAFDKISGLFGGKGKEVNKLRDEFIAAAGGVDVLRQKASDAGVSLDRFFAAKDSVSGLKAAIDEINKGLDAHQAKLAIGKQAQDDLTSAVEKYGFTQEELPAKMRQDEINAKSMELLKDFNLLKAAGFDVNVILERMGPSFEEMISTAIKGGNSIPDALRPIADQLFAQGKILDENGEAYASAEEAGLTYAATVEESMMKAVAAIEKLVNALLGIPSDVGTNIHVATTGGLPPSPEPIMAAKGFGPKKVPNLGRGFGPLIQTHAGEGVLVVPTSKMGKYPRAFHALGGFGGRVDDDERQARVEAREAEREAGGAGGGTSGEEAVGRDDIEEAARAAAEEAAAPVQEVAREIRRLAQEMKSKPQVIAPEIKPTLNFDSSPLKTIQGQEELARFQVRGMTQALENMEPDLIAALKFALGQQ